MMLNYENNKFEVMGILENKVAAKSNFDSKIIEFSDAKFVANAYEKIRIDANK